MSNSHIREIFMSADNKTRRTYSQCNTARCIVDCRTQKMGGLRIICKNCKHESFIYRSCGNRNCPRCQYVKQLRWVEARKSEFIDTTYYHAVFTLPDDLNDVVFRNQEKCFNLLFQAVSETLTEIGNNPKYLGGQLGFVSVLHTWGSTMVYHPHLHVMIMGAGLRNGQIPVKPKHEKFLFPVKALSKLFRGKFLDGLKKLNLNEKIDYSVLYGKDWIVYLKEKIHGAEHVVEYLGRYVYRIAITDSRIVSHDESKTTFRYKDYKDNSKVKEMTINNNEFVRRYLLHVLPKRFRKVRFYGILANRNKEKKLEILRIFFNCPRIEDKYKGLDAVGVLRLKYGEKACTCKKCGCDKFEYVTIPPVFCSIYAKRE